MKISPHYAALYGALIVALSLGCLPWCGSEGELEVLCNGPADTELAWLKKKNACMEHCEEHENGPSCLRLGQMLINDDPTSLHKPRLTYANVTKASYVFSRACQYKTPGACAHVEEIAYFAPRMLEQRLGSDDRFSQYSYNRFPGARDSEKTAQKVRRRAKRLCKAKKSRLDRFPCALEDFIEMTHGEASLDSKKSRKAALKIAKLKRQDQGRYNLSRYMDAFADSRGYRGGKKDTEKLIALCNSHTLYSSNACTWAGIKAQDEADQSLYLEMACKDSLLPNRSACHIGLEYHLDPDFRAYTCLYSKLFPKEDKSYGIYCDD